METTQPHVDLSDAKRQKSGDKSYAEVMCCDDSNMTDSQWDQLRCMANALLVDYMDVNAKEAANCDVDDVIGVKVDS